MKYDLLIDSLKLGSLHLEGNRKFLPLFAAVQDFPVVCGNQKLSCVQRNIAAEALGINGRT